MSRSLTAKPQARVAMLMLMLLAPVLSSAYPIPAQPARALGLGSWCARVLEMLTHKIGQLALEFFGRWRTAVHWTIHLCCQYISVLP